MRHRLLLSVVLGPAVVFWFSALPCLASPYHAEGSLRALTGERMAIRINTPDGAHTFYMKRRAPLRSGRFSSALDPKLYQGQRRHVSNAASSRENKRAALSLSGRFVRLTFFGRRGRRLYQAQGELSQDGMLQARLFHVPARFGVACGTAPSHRASSRVSPGTLAAVTQPYYAPTRYIGISTDADAEFYSAYGLQANATIQSIINEAEAIYLAQLGLRFDLLEQHYFTNTDSDPYSSTNASVLLEEFRQYRELYRHIASADIYHLFTGKEINGGTVGLGYVGAACEDNSFAYALTQDTQELNSAIQSLVFAHEVGHNFSATHPDDPTNNPLPDPFPPTPSLMNSIVEPENDFFSDYSLAQITSHIDSVDAAKSCLAETAASAVSLAVRLSSASPSKRARVNITLGSTSSSACDLTLYMSASRRHVSDSNLGQFPADLLYSHSQFSGSTTLLARFKAGDSSTRKTIYFRAGLSCTEASYLSKLRRVKPFSYGRSRSISPAITKIRAGIQAQ